MIAFTFGVEGDAEVNRNKETLCVFAAQDCKAGKENPYEKFLYDFHFMFSIH